MLGKVIRIGVNLCVISAVLLCSCLALISAVGSNSYVIVEQKNVTLQSDQSIPNEVAQAVADLMADDAILGTFNKDFTFKLDTRPEGFRITAFADEERLKGLSTAEVAQTYRMAPLWARFVTDKMPDQIPCEFVVERGTDKIYWTEPLPYLGNYFFNHRDMFFYDQSLSNDEARDIAGKLKELELVDGNGEAYRFSKSKSGLHFELVRTFEEHELTSEVTQDALRWMRQSLERMALGPFQGQTLKLTKVDLNFEAYPELTLDRQPYANFADATRRLEYHGITESQAKEVFFRLFRAADPEIEHRLRLTSDDEDHFYMVVNESFKSTSEENRKILSQIGSEVKSQLAHDKPFTFHACEAGFHPLWSINIQDVSGRWIFRGESVLQYYQGVDETLAERVADWLQQKQLFLEQSQITALLSRQDDKFILQYAVFPDRMNEEFAAVFQDAASKLRNEIFGDSRFHFQLIDSSNQQVKDYAWRFAPASAEGQH